MRVGNELVTSRKGPKLFNCLYEITTTVKLAATLAGRPPEFITYFSYGRNGVVTRTTPVPKSKPCRLMYRNDYIMGRCRRIGPDRRLYREIQMPKKLPVSLAKRRNTSKGGGGGSPAVARTSSKTLRYTMHVQCRTLTILHRNPSRRGSMWVMESGK